MESAIYFTLKVVDPYPVGSELTIKSGEVLLDPDPCPRIGVGSGSRS
jgi:hypothetical protein